MSEYKKQYRLFDIYRYISTGTKSKIMGIADYHAVHGILTTTCVDKFVVNTDITDIEGTLSEDAIKTHIRNVNAHLRNCKKPGPRKGTPRFRI